MKKLIYFFTFIFLFVSCCKDDDLINKKSSIEISDSKPEENEDDKLEDKTEIQHVLITAIVSNKFKLPVGTRWKI